MKRDQKFDAQSVRHGALMMILGMGFGGDDSEIRDNTEIRDTAARVTKAWEELLSGYDVDTKQLLKSKFLDEERIDYDQAVCLRGIEFFSTCEHHLMTFEGVVHVAYVPAKGDGVIGLSKMARLVEAYARRLQVQERMTAQIATDLFEHTGKHGAAVIIEAKHNCMRCRGVRQTNATMVTSKMLGCFFDKPEARAEVMTLLLRNT